MGNNEKIKLYGNVGFVITENCPFECAHCLRGDKRPNVLSKKAINMFLRQAEISGIVYLYGGEPLMCSELASYLINQIYRKGNHPSRIKIITNGYIKPKKLDKFIRTLKKNKAEFKIIISNDYYHKLERERLNNEEDNLIEIIAAFEFILKKYGYAGLDEENSVLRVQTYESFEGGTRVLKIGRGVNIPGAGSVRRSFDFSPYSFVKDSKYRGSIVVQTDGRVTPMGDMAWEEVDAHYGSEYSILKRSLGQILPK